NELALGDGKVIRIDSFVSPEAVDPIYFTGWSYYVLPDGPAGLHAYQLLLQGMAELRSVGIAETVLDGRDWIVSLGSRGGVLVMTGIHYDHRIRKPSLPDFGVTQAPLPSAELDLVKTLIKVSTAKRFNLSEYKDQYTDNLVRAIEAKIGGGTVVPSG